MINFASLFGSFSRGGNSAIGELLERPETTLDQLLDIESFPNEYKSGNNKIIEYLKYDKYDELLNYVTVQGPADNEKKGYKFPMVAADVLSVENSQAIDFFLPDGNVEIQVEYDSTEEVEMLVDDDEESQENQTQNEKMIDQSSESTKTQEKTQVLVQNQAQQASLQKPETLQQKTEPVPKPKKKKIITQTRPIKKKKKQIKQPLISKLLSYYQGPVNYTLAGYNCKVLNMLFTKKPTNFLNFIFKSDKNYVELICNHIESKSVGDIVTKILIWESTQFLQERIKFYNHLVYLMSVLSESHVLSNLAGAIFEIIEKTSTFIKSKINFTNNQQIVKTFLSIFYRTSQVHKIIDSAMSEQQNRSAYNCLILHAYLHHTEIQTFNSFKIEEVLENFIKRAAQKLRNVENRKVLGMGRLKIIQIFSFLIRKPRKSIQQDTKPNQISGELLQQLYIHTMISQVPDFFSILLKLLELFQNNNILHNEIYKILESILREPLQNGSLLQQLLLNDQNVLLKFILSEAQKDKKLKTNEKHTKRKGYIGHVINLCKLINEISNNSLLNSKIREGTFFYQTKDVNFQQVLNTMVATDIIQTNKTLAGYEMKKNPNREVMFQKQEILAAYSEFLTHCPKPQFEPEYKQSSQEQTPETEVEPVEQQKLKAQETAQRQLQEQEMDEQKFNQIVANSQVVNEENPKFWITHMAYDVDELLKDVD